MSPARTITSLLLGLTAMGALAQAQMLQTSVPSPAIGSSFSQGTSIGWSLQGPNWFANSGGGGPLLPPLGAAQQGAGLSGGIGMAGGGVSGSLGFNFAQGSSQSISSTTPSLTTMDGYPGSMSSGVVRPFVTGLTPVVGDYVTALAPLESAGQTAARIGQQQRFALLHSQAVLNNRKLASYLQRIDRAEAEGNKRMARANYRSAIAIAPQPLRSHLLLRMRIMMKKPVSK